MKTKVSPRGYCGVMDLAAHDTDSVPTQEWFKEAFGSTEASATASSSTLRIVCFDNNEKAKTHFSFAEIGPWKLFLYSVQNTGLEGENHSERLLLKFIECGNAAFAQLDTKFSAVLINEEEKMAMLIRDHFGQAQLYYSVCNGHAIFAPSLLSLAKHPSIKTSINWNSVFASGTPASYKNYETFVDGVYQVPESGIVTIDLESGATETTHYWTIPTSNPQSEYSDKELEEQYLKLIQDEVESKMSKGHGETISMLSGGLDSSLLTTLAAPFGVKKAITISNASTYLNGESENAIQLAKEYCIEHHNLAFSFDSLKIGPAEWMELLRITESPIVESLEIQKFHLLAYLDKQDEDLRNTTVLTGLGSDHYNGGFARLAYEATEVDEDENWSMFLDIIRSWNIDRHPTSNVGEFKNLSRFVKFDFLESREESSQENRDLWQFYLNQMKYGFSSRHLGIEEKTAAYFGVQYAHPFLSVKLVEFLASIPADRRKSFFFDKQILRNAAKEVLPTSIVNNPKAGALPKHASKGYVRESTFYHRLFTQDGSTLLNIAFESQSLNELIDKDRFVSTFELAVENEEFEFIHSAIPMLNAALLERQIVSNCGMEAPQWHIAPSITPELFFNESEVKPLLNMPLDTVKTKFHEKFKLAEGVALLSNIDMSIHYVAKGSELIIELEERELIDFIQDLSNSDLSLSDFLIARKVSLEDAEPFLESLIETDVLIPSNRT
jgi:asparagine synthase (glutamine-hydrolysing)